MFHFVFNRDSFHSHYSLKFFPSLVSWKYFFFFQRGFREGDEWGSARVGAEGVSLLVWACVWVTWRLIPAFPLQHSCTHLTFLTFLLLFFFLFCERNNSDYLQCPLVIQVCPLPWAEMDVTSSSALLSFYLLSMTPTSCSQFSLYPGSAMTITIPQVTNEHRGNCNGVCQHQQDLNPRVI